MDEEVLPAVTGMGRSHSNRQQQQQAGQSQGHRATAVSAAAHAFDGPAQKQGARRKGRRSVYRQSTAHVVARGRRHQRRMTGWTRSAAKEGRKPCSQDAIQNKPASRSLAAAEGAVAALRDKGPRRGKRRHEEKDAQAETLHQPEIDSACATMIHADNAAVMQIRSPSREGERGSERDGRTGRQGGEEEEEKKDKEGDEMASRVSVSDHLYTRWLRHTVRHRPGGVQLRSAKVDCLVSTYQGVKGREARVEARDKRQLTEK